MLALLTKNQLWMIDESAAKNLAVALRDVMSFHAININPATLAYVKLIAVCAAIYGPKLLMLNAMTKQKRTQDANTVEMPR